METLKKDREQVTSVDKYPWLDPEDERKRLCYMGILKERFSAYSSPVMLISRKLTKDKRVVTDFRHLNVRITKKQFGLSFG